MIKEKLYQISLMVILLCFFQKAEAQFEEGIPMPAVFGLPALTGSSLVNGANNTTTYSSQGETSAKILNIVTLRIKEGGPVFFATNFTATAQLALDVTDVEIIPPPKILPSLSITITQPGPNIRSGIIKRSRAM